MAKRDQIYDRIMEGGATKEILMTVAEVDAKGLASQFTYLRLTGKCPVSDENGIYRIVSAEDWDAIKAARATGGANVAKLTPTERYIKAKQAAEKAEAAFGLASTKAQADKKNKRLDLRAKIAGYTSQLRDMDLEDALAALAEAGIDVESIVMPEPKAKGKADTGVDEHEEVSEADDLS